MTTSLVSKFALLVWTACLLVSHSTSAQERKLPTAYIAFLARLDTSRPTATVVVNGVTNLPPGSVLRIEIDDYTGYRSTIFNEDTKIVVGPAGQFAATIPPKSGLSMRANLQCSAAFFPNWNQPVNVVRMFGRRGENLSGPQAVVTSGGTYLDAVAVVTQ